MNLFDKKYQIFISSTYIDLVKAREEVIKVILGLYQIPIGMEMFSADNDEQWSIIESTISTSDYYLLVLGHRYGSVTKENISYTEKEFDYAKSLGIPVLAFVRNRDTATTPQERDMEPEKAQMLDQFVSKVQNNAMCDFWKTEDELGQKVAIALTKIFFKTPRIGWIRGNNAASAETASELALLSQENRELREELTKLKSLYTVDKPIIEVKINEEALTLKWKEPRFFEYYKITDELITEELWEVVSREEIEDFNKELENKREEIADYKRKYTEYKNTSNNKRELIVEINNSGQAKANDVYVDLIFPPEIRLFEENTEFVKPKKPNVSESPLIKLENAKNAIYESRKNAMSFLSGLNLNNSITAPSFGMKFIKTLPQNKVAWVNSETNTLTIKLTKLTHTRVSIVKEDIFIAPLQKGTFEVDVKVICDQYSKEEASKLTITVE